MIDIADAAKSAPDKPACGREKISTITRPEYRAPSVCLKLNRTG
jgi:hypothetical protein